MSTYLNAALAYHAAGLCVLPVVGKLPGIKRSKDLKWKPYQTTRPTEAKLRVWFASPKVTGIAIITGPVSDYLACRDFDVEDSYQRWRQQHPKDAARLPTERTGKGYHVWFRVKPEFAGFHNFGEGDGEYRGNSGHYAITAPSAHSTGKRYEFIIPPGIAPDWNELITVNPVTVFGVPADQLTNSNNTATDGTDGTDLLQTGQTGQTEQTRGSRAASATEGRQRKTTKAKPSVATKPASPSVAPIPLVPLTPEQVIDQCVPTGPGQRHSHVFKFARGMKFNAKMPNAEACRPYFDRFFKLARPHIKTKDPLTSWIDFCDGFRRANKPLKGDVTLCADIITEPPDLSPQCDQFRNDTDGEKWMQAIRLCYWLDAYNRADGKSDFILSTKSLAAKLELSDRTAAHRILNGLVDTNVIERTFRGVAYGEETDDGKKSSGKGARFRVVRAKG